MLHREAIYDPQLSYNLFVISSMGHVERTAELKASCDADAIDQAKQIMTDKIIEIWKRGKVIICLHPPQAWL